MPLLKRITRLLGDGESVAREATTDRETVEDTTGTPSHVCQSCGKEYFADPSMEINTCQNCGGINVARV